MTRWMWEHSLTLALAAFTMIMWSIGWWKGWSFVLDLGHDAFSTVILLAFSAYLWERNKPEEPPV